MTKSSKTKTGILRQRTAFEWAILVVSSAAIATIVVGLVFYSSQFEGRPPKLLVSIEASDKENEFVLKVENRGGTTAEDVVVEVSRGEETQLVEFRAVPKAAEEEATVQLEGAGEPTASVVAFKDS